MSKEENEGEIRRRLWQIWTYDHKLTDEEAEKLQDTANFNVRAVVKVLETAKKSIPNIPDEDDPQFMFPDSYVPQIKAWFREQFGS